MGDLSRSQIAVFAAAAVVLLFVGFRSLGNEQGQAAAGAGQFGGSSDSSGSPASGEGGAGSTAGDSGNSGYGAGSDSFTVSGPDGRDVVVHVVGAVQRPGVYRLPLGSRVTDAVNRAGGGSGDAMFESVNLAARLADGQQVVVPSRPKPGDSLGTGTAAGAEDAGPISLGSATSEQLQTIDGIGPVTADSILAFRDEHGGIASIDQLDQVSGIGPATLEALRGRLQP